MGCTILTHKTLSLLSSMQQGLASSCYTYRLQNKDREMEQTRAQVYKIVSIGILKFIYEMS